MLSIYKATHTKKFRYTAMAEVAEPKVKPAETEAPAKDPKFGDFMKSLLDDKKEPEVPKQYACVLHNDATSEGFTVRNALMEAYGLSQHRATEIMMSVHRGREGVICVLAKDDAETRTAIAIKFVHDAGYPDFRITVEEE